MERWNQLEQLGMLMSSYHETIMWNIYFFIHMRRWQTDNFCYLHLFFSCVLLLPFQTIMTAKLNVLRKLIENMTHVTWGYDFHCQITCQQFCLYFQFICIKIGQKRNLPKSGRYYVSHSRKTIQVVCFWRDIWKQITWDVAIMEFFSIFLLFSQAVDCLKTSVA